MLKVSTKKQFEKDVKKQLRQGKSRHKLASVMKILENERKLEKKIQESLFEG